MKVHVPARRTYFFVAAALLLLLGLTIFAAFLPLGPLNTPVAMAVSLAKGTLILLVFMHVRYQKPFLWVFVCAGFFWLAIMFALALSDYLSRGW